MRENEEAIAGVALFAIPTFWVIVLFVKKFEWPGWDGAMASLQRGGVTLAAILATLGVVALYALWKD